MISVYNMLHYLGLPPVIQFLVLSYFSSLPPATYNKVENVNCISILPKTSLKDKRSEEALSPVLEKW